MLRDLILKKPQLPAICTVGDYRDEEETREWIDWRGSASGRNVQPLKYIISNTPEVNARFLSCWAGLVI
jgi:hypothetical protein